MKKLIVRKQTIKHLNADLRRVIGGVGSGGSTACNTSDGLCGISYWGTCTHFTENNTCTA